VEVGRPDPELDPFREEKEEQWRATEPVQNSTAHVLHNPALLKSHAKRRDLEFRLFTLHHGASLLYRGMELPN
jgi:hypothetical protein